MEIRHQAILKNRHDLQETHFDSKKNRPRYSRSSRRRNLMAMSTSRGDSSSRSCWWFRNHKIL
jgi:hypothetical protein